MRCTWHLCNNELSGKSKKFCSINCKNKFHVTNKRRNLKIQLIQQAGGKCIDCGYKGPPFMFDFDHRNPDEKSFEVNNGGNGVSIERLIAEAAKCDLVCANCHRFRTHKQRCSGCEFC